MANQKPVFFNKEAQYNDEIWTEKSANENIEYFAKNLFYFQASEISTFGDGNAIGEGIAPMNRCITLCPEGYDPKQIRLSNIGYRIKNMDLVHVHKSGLEGLVRRHLPTVVQLLLKNCDLFFPREVISNICGKDEDSFFPSD